jgi:hypothetical protein
MRRLAVTVPSVDDGAMVTRGRTGTNRPIRSRRSTTPLAERGSSHSTVHLLSIDHRSSARTLSTTSWSITRNALVPTLECQRRELPFPLALHLRPRRWGKLARGDEHRPSMASRSSRHVTKWWPRLCQPAPRASPLAVAGGLEPPTTGLTTPRLSRDICGYLLSSVVYLGLDLSAHARKRLE